MDTLIVYSFVLFKFVLLHRVNKFINSNTVAKHTVQFSLQFCTILPPIHHIQTYSSYTIATKEGIKLGNDLIVSLMKWPVLKLLHHYWQSIFIRRNTYDFCSGEFCKKQTSTC